MKLIGKSIVFGLGAAATALACSSGHAPTGPASTQTESGGSGDIGLQLTLPGGEHITTLTYSLSNGGTPLTGTYNIGATNLLSFTIGSVPAGSGYRLSLSATTDDSKITCSYPAADVAVSTETPFSILNRTTTSVSVNMQCVNNTGLDSGSLLVVASESNCPVWNTVVANPENITLPNGANVDSGAGTAGSTAFYPNQGTPVTAVINDGTQLVLVGSATAPNPGALVFNWSACPSPTSGPAVPCTAGTPGLISSTNGTIDPNSTDAGTTNQTVFTCPAPPSVTTTYTVTLSLSDGFDAAACDSNWTTGLVQVQCTNPAACGGGPTATSPTGTCTAQGGGAAGNDANGYPYVATSTMDPSGVYCCAGACGDGAQLATALGVPSVPASEALPTGGTCAPVGTTALNDVNGCCLPLIPCTGTNLTGCVSCSGWATGTGSNGGECTPTEALIVQYDINKGLATAAGPDPNTSCYACLEGVSALDDSANGLTGKECTDSFASGGTAAECETTLGCLLNTQCSAGAVSACFCGSASPTGSCDLNPAPAANGACQADIAAGIFVSGTAIATTDGQDALTNLINAAMASGRADSLMQKAHSNGCTMCY